MFLREGFGTRVFLAGILPLEPLRGPRSPVEPDTRLPRPFAVDLRAGSVPSAGRWSSWRSEPEFRGAFSFLPTSREQQLPLLRAASRHPAPERRSPGGRRRAAGGAAPAPSLNSQTFWGTCFQLVLF